ncbi:uncharacterized protein [Coffea arabica]|uniref:Uncharacterized protein isoform X1 n=1 Tax=Coffea arabica TaxID=13443 RepID=A0A6P6VTU4_COFAR|nr:uncharacterized protein LOC113726820 isoform X1 [Coffea arabica]
MNAAAAVTNAITRLPFPPPIGYPFAQNENPRRVIESLRFPSTSSSAVVKTVSLSLEQEFRPNALRKKQDSSSRCGFSLGVDLGLSRTGLAISKGFVIRPLTVLELRGQKLELRLLDIAQNQEVDEFIIGLPISIDGRETPQSNKVRSVAGRLAVRAAERGLRVYLQDEYGTSTEALDRMIDMGLSKSGRRGRIDAYAAAMVLEKYFSESGGGVELVLPKQLDLQNKLRDRGRFLLRKPLYF